ncbi:MAG: sensor histidine kinase [Candidatus Krumholzibacteriota bacterium]|nr:sensor histidine kinase [Candidatus Krumholzibacteriota bacterium]
MAASGIHRVTRLVALFTLLMVGAWITAGWIFHGLLGDSLESLGRQDLRDQGRLLQGALAAHPGGARAAWAALDADALRAAAGLDRLELLDAEGRSLAADADRLPATPPSARLMADLALGLEASPPPWREGGELYHALYLPLMDENGELAAVLALEAGAETSSRLADLQRGLWAATGAALAFVVFVMLAMGAILRQARRRQAALDRAGHLARVGTLAAGLAHEIRNPLAIIGGNAELIDMRAADADLRERAGEILEEVERLRRLLTDFLHFARPGDLRLQEIEPRAFWETVLAEQRVLHAGVAMDLAAGDGLPILRADPDRLRQAARNLLANAAVAAGAGGRVSVDLAATGDRLRVVVSDDGPGVPAGLRENLFEPFVSGREGGTGLGLAVSLGIARAHGGTLRLDRSGPEGSVFVLELPLDAVEGDGS